jgi:hypothetical protein
MTWLLGTVLGISVAMAVGFVLGRIELNLSDPSDPWRNKATFNGGTQQTIW